MKFVNPRLANQFDGIHKLFFRFCRKTANEIRAKCRFRPNFSYFTAQINDIFPRMTAAHPFENHIIARLNRKMEMRRQIFVFPHKVYKLVIDSRRIQ